MQRFLIRRILLTMVTLLAVSLIIFVLSRAAGDPRHVYLDDYSTQADWDKLTLTLGLDRPYYQQYAIFLKDAVRGKFGKSIKEGRPSMEIIIERLPATLQLGLAAFIFSVVVGVPLGILSAVKRGTALDVTGKLVALVGQSAPVFWLGLMLMFLFAVKLQWLPPYGRQEPTSIILPAVALGWFYAAANMRLLRSAMLNVLDSEYVKLARAKGVSSQAVIWKHSLRNALIPVLTFAGVTLGALVTGSIVVETVFAWPGLGQLSIQARNVPPAWLEGGSTKYLLGTDHLGRDLLSRVIYGARISLVVVAVALGIGGTMGVVLGLVAGWYGRWVEELIMRLVDIKLAIPTILLALVLVLALGQSFLIIVVILAIAIWPRFARNVRGEVLQLKTMDYVALAKVAGASTPRILFKHIFPGVVNTLIILATLEVGIVILLESTLSFLGAGVPPPTPAWGSMVADGRDRMAVAWWISTMPGVAIMLVVLSMNLFGDWLRDKLDPRLRQLQ